LLERIYKISIPIGGTGFTIEILSTASEEAYSERAASGSKVPKVPCLRVAAEKFTLLFYMCYNITKFITRA
jgi:hypothetical protein